MFEKNSRTDDGLLILIYVKSAGAVVKQTRQKKKVFDRPSKIVRVDDETEKIDGGRRSHDSQHFIMSPAVRQISVID